MSVRTSPWPMGVPCWTDLSTPDVEAAQRFYAAVLGWEFQESDEDYGGYVIAEVRGSATAGIGPVMGDQQVPSWTLYVASDDADASAAAVSEHGGAVLMPPGDVGPLGRMFIAADHVGGVFGVWQAGSHIGASLVNEPGGITWEDLRSSDPDRARQFYGEVFGYEFRPLTPAMPDYTTFHTPGEDGPLGGMGALMGAPAGTPSHWLVYFSVADVDQAVTAAEGQQGSLLAPAFDTEFGRMAGLVDPAGAAFWIAQSIPGRPQPDRAG